MIELYTFPSCPYCEKVRRAFADMNFEYTEIDASPGTPGSAVVMEKGGKLQVPFLVNTEDGFSMYESDDIIAYARQRSA